MTKRDKATPAEIDLAADVTTEAAQAEMLAVTDDQELTAAQVADHLGVDPKSFRAWVRRQRGTTLPKGAEYSFPASDLEAIAKAYGNRRGGKVHLTVTDDGRLEEAVNE